MTRCEPGRWDVKLGIGANVTRFVRGGGGDSSFRRRVGGMLLERLSGEREVRDRR